MGSQRHNPQIQDSPLEGWGISVGATGSRAFVTWHPLSPWIWISWRDPVYTEGLPVFWNESPMPPLRKGSIGKDKPKLGQRSRMTRCRGPWALNQSGLPRDVVLLQVTAMSKRAMSKRFLTCLSLNVLICKRDNSYSTVGMLERLNGGGNVLHSVLSVDGHSRHISHYCANSAPDTSIGTHHN